MSFYFRIDIESKLLKLLYTQLETLFEIQYPNENPIAVATIGIADNVETAIAPTIIPAATPQIAAAVLALIYTPSL